MWDWGTWAPVGTDDPLAAVEAGDLHFDLHGEKLAGRFVLVRRGAGDGASGCCSRSGTTPPSRMGPPRTIPRSVKSGRTNDEVKGRTSGELDRERPLGRPDADELAALDALKRAGDWRLGEHTCT